MYGYSYLKIIDLLADMKPFITSEIRLAFNEVVDVIVKYVTTEVKSWQSTVAKAKELTVPVTTEEITTRNLKHVMLFVQKLSNIVYIANNKTLDSAFNNFHNVIRVLAIRLLAISETEFDFCKYRISRTN